MGHALPCSCQLFLSFIRLLRGEAPGDSVASLRGTPSGFALCSCSTDLLLQKIRRGSQLTRGAAPNLEKRMLFCVLFGLSLYFPKSYLYQISQAMSIGLA